MKNWLFALCCLAAMAAASARAASPVDAKAEREAAIKAEKAGDWGAALLHYENIYDSTICSPEQYVELRRKFEELRAKIEPKYDPAKAAVYHLRSFAFRTLQVGDRKNTYNDEQLKDFEKVHSLWADEVWKASRGQCRLDWKAVVIDKPMTKFAGFPSPYDCIPSFDGLQPGEADYVTAYTLSSGLGCSCWAGTYGSVAKGAAYGGFNDGGDGGTCGNGEVQIHEWIHGLEMTLKWHHLYPDAIFPNPDATGNCGPKCWQPKPGEGGWYNWYRHILTTHLTRKMWRELSLTRPSESVWLADWRFCPRFATLGPFDGNGKDKNGFDEAFINESDMKPAIGKQEGGKTWRAADRVGFFLNLAGVYYPVERQVAYAGVIARVSEPRAAQFRAGASSACKAWHDGRLIVDAPNWGGCGRDHHRTDVQLAKGDNLFVIKVVNSGSKDWADWGVTMRITDKDGKPLAGVEYALPRAKVSGTRRVPDTGPQPTVLLDIASQTVTPDHVKQAIEWCGLYKVRYLQLELSNEAGWVFPSKAFPKLGECNRGARGGVPADVFTRESLLELVKFAESRGITLVPAIETPGGCYAMRAAMPELFDLPKRPGPGAGPRLAVLNMTNDKNYEALDTLIGEICEVFAKSPMVHVGGREPDFKSFRELLPNADPKTLLAKHFKRMNEFLTKRGKGMIVWDTAPIDVAIKPQVSVMKYDDPALAAVRELNGDAMLAVLGNRIAEAQCRAVGASGVAADQDFAKRDATIRSQAVRFIQPVTIRVEGKIETPMPFVLMDQPMTLFNREATVTMESSVPGKDIYYTLDGTDPRSDNSLKYTAPLKLRRTLRVKAGLFDAEGRQIGGYSQVSLLCAPNIQVSLTTGKPVKATRIEADYRPEYAVDGLVEPSNGWWSDTGNQSLEVDLLKLCHLDCVQVFPYWGDNRYYQYKVSASADGKAWTQIVDMSKNTKSSTKDGHLHMFPVIDARYLRVTMIRNNANGGVHVVEFRAYAPGTGPEDVTKAPMSESPRLGNLSLIPWPKSLALGQGELVLTDKSRIVAADASLEPLARVLAREILLASGLRLSPANGAAQDGDIVLQLDAKLQGERYEMEVAPRAVLRGANYQAVAQGTATLLQAITSAQGRTAIPAMTVRDWPDASWRGLMIDCARGWHPIDNLRQCIELCRLYKVRYFHIHLTDNENWVFPSKTYPQYTADPKVNWNGGHSYKWEELEALVKFADERGVTIVPEIDMPGHNWAAGRAAAQLMFGAMETDQMYVTVDNLIGDLCQLFKSSPYIHIGCDEVNWLDGLEKRPAVKAFLDREKLENPCEMWYNLIVRVNEMVKKRGKQTIVWEGFHGDGSAHVKIPKDILVMEFEVAYNMPQTLINLGYRVINTSWKPLYVVNWNVVPPEHIHAWNMHQFKGTYTNPSPEVLGVQLPQSNRVTGAQTCAWEQPDWKEIPSLRERLPAMNDPLWNPGGAGTYADFQKRFRATDALLQRLIQPVSFTARGAIWPDGQWGLQSVYRQPLHVELTRAFAVPGVEIRYTLNGKEPTADSPAYRGPIELTTANATYCHNKGDASTQFHQTVLKMRLFDGPNRLGYTRTHTFDTYDGLAQQPQTVRYRIYDSAGLKNARPDDFGKVKLVREGTLPRISLDALRPLPDGATVVFEGQARFPKSDMKALGFDLRTGNDGGRLYLGDTLVLDRNAPKEGTRAAGATLVVQGQGEYKAGTIHANVQDGWAKDSLFQIESGRAYPFRLELYVWGSRMEDFGFGWPAEILPLGGAGPGK